MQVASDLKRKFGRAVLWVAFLSLAYFAVELVMALRLGSVALLADSIDLFEDVAINVLIFIALGWSLRGCGADASVWAQHGCRR